VNGVREKTPVPGRRSVKEPLSPVAALVRRYDRDRFQTTLFAPADRREALFALYAFNYEIARVRESVTQPILGRIRLEWWRENVAAAYDGSPVRRHPVAEALSEVIRRNRLTKEHFARLIDARAADFDEDPPTSLAALENYVEGTSSHLVYLALEVLGAGDRIAKEAAHHIGIAYGLAGLLRTAPLLARRGRSIIPADIAAQRGVEYRNGPGRGASTALCGAVADIAAAARTHLRDARNLRGGLQRPALPALLPAVVADRSLRRLQRAGCDPFDPALARPDPLQSWRLAFAALFNRF